MGDGNTHFHDHSATSVAARVGELKPTIDAITQFDSPTLNEVKDDVRILAYMAALTRQREALAAALRLAGDSMGHLSVGFVRPACEEYLWLKYLAMLNKNDASDVLLAMGSSEVIRSLSAARGYIGDSNLNRLGFPLVFLEASQAIVDSSGRKIEELSGRLGWRNKRGPKMEWIAKTVGEADLYNYLYAASSRAIHFSAGEILRRSWFDADGRVGVEDVDHRVYLSDFALDQLALLAIKTFTAASAWLIESSKSNSSSKSFEADILEPLKKFMSAPRVPLVLAKEYEIAWKSFPMRS